MADKLRPLDPDGSLLFPLRSGVCQTHTACFYWPAEKHAGAQGLTLLYLGANSLFLSDGRTHLLVDPYFSRPAVSMLRLALSGRQRVIPDPARIRRTLRAAHIPAVTAIVLTHAHYDHALDAAVIARQLAGCEQRPPVIYGSDSVANIGRGWGLPEEQLVAISPGWDSERPVMVGDFRLTFLPSQHIRLPVIGVPFPGHISAPLPQPAPVSAYKAGHVFSLHLVHPLASLFIQGSAGLLRGQDHAPEVDCLVLPIAAVDLQTEQWRKQYLDRVIVAANPSTVFFSHWDDYHQSLNQPPAWVAGRPGRGPTASLAYFRAKQPNRPFHCLPIGLPLLIRSKV